jgi:hypothetical protein
MSKIKVADYDFVFLSYDEPNADENYQDLLTKVPNAKRVHGVKGFDSAHKECARVAETDRFVTIDGDTQIDKKFLNIEFDTDEIGATDNHIFSWSGKIDINGLIYGNGSLKLWPKSVVEQMQTHEHSTDSANAVDFCYSPLYFQFNDNYSTSIISKSPNQAWRAGFREGVKMNLKRGERDPGIRTWSRDNYVRLLFWGSVGRDYENGIYSMLGAGHGSYLVLSDWDFNASRDFDALDYLWASIDGASESEIDELMEFYRIENAKIGPNFCELSAEQSKFVKETFTHPTRVWKEYKY